MPSGTKSESDLCGHSLFERENARIAPGLDALYSGTRPATLRRDRRSHYDAGQGSARSFMRPSVMIAALRYFQKSITRLARYAIDQAVFLGDAARPPAGKRKFQCFRLAEPAERTALISSTRALIFCNVPASWRRQ
jgi:hypothetical protein